MSSHAFESLRLIMVVLCVLLRLTLMPWYLQAYLDMARVRVEEQKKEAGRITNVDLQKKVLLFYFVFISDLVLICNYYNNIC